MLLCSGVVEPQIACDRRCVVLTEVILATLAVLIEELLAVGTKVDSLCRCCQYTLGTTTLDANGIQLSHITLREEDIGCGVGDGCAVVNLLTIVRECVGLLLG